MVNDEEFKVWVDRQPRASGQMDFRGAMLKDGPQVAKTVTLAAYDDPQTGEVKKREIRFKTVPRRTDGPGFAFDAPTKTWACENGEIDKLQAFLQNQVQGTSRYRLVDTASPQAALIEMVGSGGVVTELVAALVADGKADQLVQALSRSAGGLAAAESAVLAQRRELVAQLRELAEDPTTTETDMQRALGDSYWLFGGRYVGVAERRNIAPLDQHDIPLLAADGTLHIVELKGTRIPRLVRQHRNHPIVGNDVHEAVSQAMNYLRTLDEMGAALTTLYRDDLGAHYDLRRVFATVVIGHPAHVEGVDTRQVEQTIRTYNAHLSRVEVITYAALLDSAERTLDFEQGAVADVSEKPPPAVEDPWAVPATDPWADEPPF